MLMRVFSRWFVLVFLFAADVVYADKPVAMCLGSSNEWAPYSYYHRDDQGNVDKSKTVGGSYELLVEAFKLNNLEHTVEYMPWKRVQVELDNYDQTKTCEITIDASFKTVRAEKFFYTVPLYRTHLGVFYSTNNYKEKPQIQSTDDLMQHSICGVIGYNYNKFKIQPDSIVETNSLEQIIKMLSAKRCDLLPSSLEPIYGNALTGDLDLTDDIKSVRVPGLYKTFYAIIAKKSPRGQVLTNQLNQEIIRMQENGRAEEIFKAHIATGSGLSW